MYTTYIPVSCYILLFRLDRTIYSRPNCTTLLSIHSVGPTPAMLHQASALIRAKQMVHATLLSFLELLVVLNPVVGIN